MVSIDTVYQKVLAIVNKEQRGYVTPQEFNLFVDKATKEIFESYFTQPEQKLHKNQSDDTLDMLAEKMNFHLNSTFSIIETIPAGQLYKATFAHCIDSDANIRKVTYISKKEYSDAVSNPLTSPTDYNRVFYRDSFNAYRIFPFTNLTSWTIDGYVAPAESNWDYVVVNGKALYNPNSTTNIDLHDSEEENLVSRILELSGMVVQKPGLVEIAKSDRMLYKQEQNS
tara:strand:- start:26176 stop:26853 length:678 start_codon:yes stop_codon:yes gene_type:complete